ncbi:hypothetical protein GOP47_0019818 [Adiantum capillus-veneris]|uniref:Uncharacterized protein n=1 Tax=Adiantum capillus-veneris TaxID=13818 RepID=A0A9D4Z7E5_ADICA|nr:hypothetical protein GOP47_0019818 [Adiantum capillus-veneris]
MRLRSLLSFLVGVLTMALLLFARSTAPSSSAGERRPNLSNNISVNSPNKMASGRPGGSGHRSPREREVSMKNPCFAFDKGSREIDLSVYEGEEPAVR